MQDSRPASEQFSSLFVKILVKTALKAVIWFGLAAVITYFYPTAAWAWYVAIAFVAIGLAFSGLMLAGAFVASRKEQEAANSPSEHEA